MQLGPAAGDPERAQSSAVQPAQLPLANEATMRALSAVWDSCNNSRAHISEGRYREQSDRLSREILDKLGIWRGIQSGLPAGADDLVAQLPKNVRNIASRAVEMRALLAEQSGDLGRAYVLCKFATQISGAAPEVVATLVRLTTSTLPTSPPAESSARKEYALSVLLRHVDSFEIRGDAVPERLTGNQARDRDRALWALQEAARYSLGHGLAIHFGPPSNMSAVPDFERVARYASNALRLFLLPHELAELDRRISAQTLTHPAQSGYPAESIRMLSRVLQFAGEALQQRGDPLSAGFALRSSVWLWRENPEAVQALRLLFHAAPNSGATRPIPPPPAASVVAAPSRQPAPVETPEWMKEIGADWDWELMRAAPPEKYGWETGRQFREALGEARMKLGFERAGQLVPETLLQEVAADLMLLEHLPRTFLANFFAHAEAVLSKADNKDAPHFVSLLRLEACLHFISQAPSLDAPAKSRADILKHRCETEARHVQKPLGLGSTHGPILNVFRVLTEFRTAQRKKH